ncbi:MAG: hypothetical protein VX970_03540 [Planctomycetota bacterium]|nr:hypothetical protein [Planctomycetota bacterium]
MTDLFYLSTIMRSTCGSENRITPTSVKSMAMDFSQQKKIVSPHPIRVQPFSRRMAQRSLIGLCVATLMLLAFSAPALAADAEIPKPRNVNLTTKDGVQLNIVYYEGTEGEDTVPVVVIHDWKSKEEGATYTTLAEYLQRKGYAVILPDLRGHGDSTKQKIKSSAKTIKFGPNEVAPESVIAGDLEAIRMFLLKENNAKKLNLAATTLVGVGKGAILAAFYAIYDWDPNRRGGNPRASTKIRGGNEDVKALVLISPENKIGSLKADGLKDDKNMGSGEISTLILVGQKQAAGNRKNSKKTKEFKTAKYLYEKLKRTGHETESDDVGKWTLFFNVIDTELNGEKLVNETNLDLKAREYVRSFLNLRVRDQGIPWTERKPYKN